MNLLEDKLVKKYFGNCQNTDCQITYCNLPGRVIAAMQEPIKKGERCLVLPADMDVYEEIEESGLYDNNAHTNRLKIPPRFQTPEKKECQAGFLKCMDCGEEIIHKSSVKFHPPEYMGHSCPTWREKSGCHCSDPDPVEEKIKEIIDDQPMTLNKSVATLRELVALARSTKEK